MGIVPSENQKRIEEAKRLLAQSGYHVTPQSAYERHLKRIIHIGREHSNRYGELRMTPTGQRLLWFLEDIGVVSAWEYMRMTRWQMVKRTFYRVVLGKDWWPEVC